MRGPSFFRFSAFSASLLFMVVVLGMLERAWSEEDLSPNIFTWFPE